MKHRLTVEEHIQKAMDVRRLNSKRCKYCNVRLAFANKGDACFRCLSRNESELYITEAIKEAEQRARYKRNFRNKMGRRK